MSPRKRPRKRPRKKKQIEERVEERAEEEDGEEEQERLTSGQRYALLVAVLVILGVGVIFIDTILAWVMGLLGRS